jgi:hypothetical protein
MPIQPTQESAIQASLAFAKPLRVRLVTPARFVTPIKIVFVARSPHTPSSSVSPLPAPSTRKRSGNRKASTALSRAHPTPCPFC